MAEELYQVTTSYMCAGLVLSYGRVVEAAPILNWTLGKPLGAVTTWVAKKQGSVVRLNG